MAKDENGNGWGDKKLWVAVAVAFLTGNGGNIWNQLGLDKMMEQVQDTTDYEEYAEFEEQVEEHIAQLRERVAILEDKHKGD